MINLEVNLQSVGQPGGTFGACWVELLGSCSAGRLLPAAGAVANEDSRENDDDSPCCMAAFCFRALVASSSSCPVGSSPSWSAQRKGTCCRCSMSAYSIPRHSGWKCLPHSSHITYASFRMAAASSPHLQCVSLAGAPVSPPRSTGDVTRLGRNLMPCLGPLGANGTRSAEALGVAATAARGGVCFSGVGGGGMQVA